MVVKLFIDTRDDVFFGSLALCSLNVLLCNDKNYDEQEDADWSNKEPDHAMKE